VAASLEDPVAESTLPPDRARSLRKLAELMNTRHKRPFPVTEPLLQCFDVALTAEEADFLIKLGTEPCTLDTAAPLSTLPKTRFRAFFEGLVRKGFLWPQETREGREEFALAGIMLGWFEIYLWDGLETPEKQEFARRLDDLFKSYKKLNAFPWRSLINYRARRGEPHQSILTAAPPPEGGHGRTIPVGKTIDAGSMKVYPARTVEELIEKHGDGNRIAVGHCFCRQYHKMIGESCRFKHMPQSCISIGELSRYMVDYGTGRYLSKPEAIALVRELQAKGAVHQVFHKDEDVRNPEIAICNCCWDCCGVFGSYNRGIIPLNLHSYFEARIPDLSVCSGCGICAGYCPVQAISMTGDQCRIDAAKCIGCGQCEIQCPEKAVRLIANERAVFLPMRKKSDARIP
jgi:ferredoxin